MKILLVEDNERVSQFVIKGLQEAGHTMDHAANGRDGMFLAASEPYDVIIMDRMLPGDIDGLAIIEVLRKAGKRTPILILSALSEVDDRIRGLPVFNFDETRFAYIAERIGDRPAQFLVLNNIPAAEYDLIRGQPTFSLDGSMITYSAAFKQENWQRLDEIATPTQRRLVIDRAPANTPQPPETMILLRVTERIWLD